MYSREEKKELNQAFFKKFVRHMSVHRSTGGGGGRWEAYKTGVKGLYFRILTYPDVGIAIDLQFKDPEIRELFYDQFLEMRKLLESEWGESVTFTKNYLLDSGVTVSRIQVQLPGVYFYDKDQWPQIITWYEQKMLGLDSFWETVGDVVKGLAR